MTDRNLYATLTDPENQPHQYSSWLTVEGNFVRCRCGSCIVFGDDHEALERFADAHRYCRDVLDLRQAIIDLFSHIEHDKTGRWVIQTFQGYVMPELSAALDELLRLAIKQR